MWSNEKVLKLIEDYQGFYCLWDVTTPDYKNRVKRKEAMESLAKKHNVTVVEIEKKIHNLKTAFNREWKKRTPMSGTSPKKSTWFAYEYLQFLLPAKESKVSRNTDLDDIHSGNNLDEDSLLDTGESEEQESLNADAELEDDLPFKTPKKPLKRVRKNEDSLAQQADNCMKSLSEIVSIRDEHSVFGEYVANKLRNCKRPRVEVSLAQHYINDILFRLDMGLLAPEIPSIQTPHTPTTSSIASHSPSSHVSRDSYCSNPSTPTGIEEVGHVQQH